MRPTQVAKALRKGIETKQPMFIWGGTGVGKSQVAAQTAREYSPNFIDLRLSLLDAVDLRGFPHFVDGRMHFATPIFLPTDPDSEGVLFLDEMNVAPPSVQAAGYQLVLDRRIGEYRLPPGWAIFGAGNREQDQGVTYTMPAPLANRFTHLDYDPHLGDWRKHANAMGFKTEVCNFIAFRPNLLYDFDADKRAFPTPRSWEYVSRILDEETDKEVERALIAGSVGDGAAAEFAGFLKIYRSLPDPDVVLMNPKNAEVPKDPATLYALCGALSARASEANFDRLIEYCRRIKEEFQVLCIRDSVAKHPPLADTEEFSRWAIDNADVLV